MCDCGGHRNRGEQRKQKRRPTQFADEVTAGFEHRPSENPGSSIRTRHRSPASPQSLDELANGACTGNFSPRPRQRTHSVRIAATRGDLAPTLRGSFRSAVGPRGNVAVARSSSIRNSASTARNPLLAVLRLTPRKRG